MRWWPPPGLLGKPPSSHVDSPWHLPLWLTGRASNPLILFPPFVLSAIALSVLLAWIYNSTGGSLLLVVLLHATANLPVTLLITPLGIDMIQPFLIFTALLIIASIAVIRMMSNRVIRGRYHPPGYHSCTENTADTASVGRPARGSAFRLSVVDVSRRPIHNEMFRLCGPAANRPRPQSGRPR
jgi:hypothetical protein